MWVWMLASPADRYRTGKMYEFECIGNVLNEMPKMIIDWFNAKEAQKFGLELAAFFIERIPPEASRRKDKTTAKKQEVLSKMFQQIARFKLRHKLNFYKKAKFGNSFQWALKDAGYANDFIKDMTKEVLLKFK